MPSRETIVIDAARAGATYARDHFETVLDVERKSGKTDLVTDIDRMTQRQIVSVINEYFPNDEIVGEEEDERKTVPDEGYAWIIDPIDGTQNYVHGIPEWVTSVAVVHDGDPVSCVNVAPALDERYRSTQRRILRDGQSISVSDRTDVETFLVAPTLPWQKSDSEIIGVLSQTIIERFGELRRTGSAQLTLSMVASGAFDAAVTLDTVANPWDTVAGVHHVRQAGGVVTDVEGDEWNTDSQGVVASNGNNHDAIVEAVQTVLNQPES
ncbi:inositol monophosphatase [Haloprofundus marisrubri]|uniref:fructose-bisphosphatase n=1 Tax=Haloprofundus marisrubri TaxID=1514971 RepID=A0A0W1RD94_9EURY|nr:inositol monophosphatase family protein [Haloprofundus marisrubri]KTG11454.1 inositol monophosphatase [Haloprofundus marisrubri]